MGLPTSIETLIEGTIVESARIEFKETWDPQASLKTICSFANDIDNWGGGYLVIGVREDTAGYRTVVGVPTDKVDLWLKDMVNKCKLIQPDYMPIVDVAEYEGKALIVVWRPAEACAPTPPLKAWGKRASGFIGYAKWRALCRHPRLRDATCTTSPIMSLSMIACTMERKLTT